VVVKLASFVALDLFAGASWPELAAYWFFCVSVSTPEHSASFSFWANSLLDSSLLASGLLPALVFNYGERTPRNLSFGTLMQTFIRGVGLLVRFSIVKWMCDRQSYTMGGRS